MVNSSTINLEWKELKLIIYINQKKIIHLAQKKEAGNFIQLETMIAINQKILSGLNLLQEKKMQVKLQSNLNRQIVAT